MSDRRNLLVGRPDWSRRLLMGVLGTVFVPLSVWGILVGNRVAPVFLLLGIFALSEAWRRAVVRDGTLVAQGRLVRRTVVLADLTAVGLSPVVRPWVATRDGRAFYLRMVNDLGGPGDNPGPVVFVEELREIATRAGARLEELPNRAPPPRGASPLFSF